jgi:hypothetical protein
MRHSVVTQLIAATGLLDGAKARLFKTPMGSDPNLAASDFAAVEADFDGYAASATLTWGAVGVNALNQADVTAQEVEWVPTGSLTPNVIYGYFVTDATGVALLFWASLVAPFAVQSPSTVVRIVPTFIHPENLF